MDLINIAESWLMLAKADPDLVEMAKKRLAICDSCPNKKQLSGTGQWLTQLINDRSSTFYCGLCGCPLASKTINPNNFCPDNPHRWLREITAYY